MLRLFWALVASSIATFTVRGQTDVPYFEVINHDSVRLFVDAASMFSTGATRFTGRECAHGYRLARVNANGTFEGKFRDYFSMQKYLSVLMAEGYYREGKKSGQFKWYYTDGKVMCEGTYADDWPVGTWKFYSVNGKLTLGLDFADRQEPLINFMFDEKSNLVLVKDGNGEARFVSQLGEQRYSVSGRVKDGLPEGEWIGEADITFAGSQQTKKSIRRESYRGGVMVAGKKFQSGRITDVCCTPELSRVYPLPEILDVIDLEAFPIEPCPGDLALLSTEAPPVPRSAVPTSNILTFSSSVKSTILAKYRGRQVGEGYNETIPGNEENRLVVHFHTDENGRPIKTKLVSAYGREFYPPIKRSLESLTKWQPNQEKIVLTVYIRMGVYSYNYRINFSLD